MKNYNLFLGVQALCLSLAITSCGTGVVDDEVLYETNSPTMTTLIAEETTTVIQETEPDYSENIKSAYDNLNYAFMMTSAAMNDISKTWKFVINYKYEDYKEFATYMGITPSSVASAFRSLFEKDASLYFSSAMSELTYGILLIHEIHVNADVYDNIDKALEIVKNELKIIDTNHKTYNDLLSYYSELLPYFEFVKSPSGSYSTLSSTIDSYEQSIKIYQTKLSIFVE